MAKPVMEISGLRELQDALKSGEKSIREKASQAVSVSTFAATNRMRTAAPEATGNLKRAIGSDVRGLSGRVTIDESAYYWRFIEFGTIHQNARPFVRETAEQEIPDFEKRMEAVANEVAGNIESHRGGL